MGLHSEGQSLLMRFQGASRRLKRLLSSSIMIFLIAVAVLTTILIKFGNDYISSTNNRTVRSHNSEHDSNLPDVIIYRRTKKTGSSSMLEELLRETSVYGYVPLYDGGQGVKNVVRAEGVKTHPRRLLLAEHNSVTRNLTVGRKTVIMDTIRDGYKQITSHCRHVLGVSDCGKQLIECLRGPALKERYYRWAGAMEEDDDTFIDIPLSSEHPALSTTVFRHIFPSAVLNIKHRNLKNSSCPEDPRIRKVYNANYKNLDKIVRVLRMRLLSLAGYPLKWGPQKLNLEEVLEAAESLEREKYLKEENLVFGGHESSRSVSKAHSQLQQDVKIWARDENGKIVLIKRSSKNKKIEKKEHDTVTSDSNPKTAASDGL